VYIVPVGNGLTVNTPVPVIEQLLEVVDVTLKLYTPGSNPAGFT